MMYKLYDENGKYIGLFDEAELNKVVSSLKGDVFIIDVQGVKKYLIKIWEVDE